MLLWDTQLHVYFVKLHFCRYSILLQGCANLWLKSYRYLSATHFLNTARFTNGLLTGFSFAHSHRCHGCCCSQQVRDYCLVQKYPNPQRGNYTIRFYHMRTALIFFVKHSSQVSVSFQNVWWLKIKNALHDVLDEPKESLWPCLPSTFIIFKVHILRKYLRTN